MVNLQGKRIYLRALEPEDIDFLYELENNPAVWEISNTITPYSKHVLNLYLDNAYRDIYEVKQLRLSICNSKKKVIGLIDLFDFDPKNLRAGIGLVVLPEDERNKGIGSEAVELMAEYAFSILGLRQLYANVIADNSASIHLFKKLGFETVGIKKDWILSRGLFKNEILFQKIKK